MVIRRGPSFGVTNEGLIWYVDLLGQQVRLNFVDGGTFELVRSTILDNDNIYGFGTHQLIVKTPLVEANNQFWFGASEYNNGSNYNTRLGYFDGSTGQISIVAANDNFSTFSPAVTSGPDGSVWFYDDEYSRTPSGSSSALTHVGYFLIKINTQSNSVTRYPIAYASVNDMTFGSDGNLWMAVHQSSGQPYNVIKLFQFNPTTGVSQTFEHQLSGSFENAQLVSQPDGSLWLLDGGDVARYDISSR